MQLCAVGGVITETKVYSDAMDWQLAPAWEAALLDCPFRVEELQRVLRGAIADKNAAEDLCRLLADQQL